LKWVDAGEVFSMLATAYDGARRHYHNLRHVRQCLEALDEIRAKCAQPDAVEAAIWFHDVVYDPTRGDNEARSADVADEALRRMGADERFIETVRELILDTRHVTPAASVDGRILVDIDLSILGRQSDEFDDYEQAIRHEYAHVPDEAFASGRARILQGFLAWEWIYATGLFRERYEAAARENLGRSLARLESSGGKMRG
jgi:predicted metal-dependent HD superfamily phosphohydrolase